VFWGREGNQCSLMDDDLWAIATGMDFPGIERHFLVYANRRGFTIRSRAKGTHSTLKELSENNVREEIAFIRRINVNRFQHRPRPLYSMRPSDKAAYPKNEQALRGM
jgi:hypothetical protein